MHCDWRRTLFLTRTSGVHHEKPFDLVDLFLGPAIFLPIGRSGFREPVPWIGQVVVKMSAMQKYYWDENSKTFSEGPTSTLDWFNFLMRQNKQYCLILRKGPVDLKHQTGPLGKSLIRYQQTELQGTACRWNVPIPTFLECTCWLEKKESNAPARTLF